MSQPFNAQHPDYPMYQRACAEIMELENITYVDGVLYHGRSSLQPASTYLDDASIDAVVRKLDDDRVSEYANILTSDIDGRCVVDWWSIVQRTESEKAEALCRTLMGGKE